MDVDLLTATVLVSTVNRGISLEYNTLINQRKN